MASFNLLLRFRFQPLAKFIFPIISTIGFTTFVPTAKDQHHTYCSRKSEPSKKVEKSFRPASSSTNVLSITQAHLAISDIQGSLSMSQILRNGIINNTRYFFSSEELLNK